MAVECALLFSTQGLKLPILTSLDSVSTMTSCRMRMAVCKRDMARTCMATEPRFQALSGGLRQKAQIGSFRVLGSSLSARTAQVSIAARKSIALGYNILNCSFGCGISGHLPIYKEWVDSALLSGIHVVAASGSPETSEWPAYLTSVLGVDCALSNDGGLRYLPGRMVEFAAPAAEVRVPWKNGGHRVMTGSSFAAAWLSGMLARLLSVYPEIDPFLAKTLLRRVAGEGMEGSPDLSRTRS